MKKPTSEGAFPDRPKGGTATPRHGAREISPSRRESPERGASGVSPAISGLGSMRDLATGRIAGGMAGGRLVIGLPGPHKQTQTQIRQVGWFIFRVYFIPDQSR